MAILLSVVPAGAQAPSPAGSDARLGEKILALLDQGSEKTAHWGLAVVSLKDSRKLVGWNEDKFFVPASTAKIITAAAALTQLGPDFKYHTTVGRTGTVTAQGELDGDIVLVGRGDPNLSGRIFPYRRGPKRNRDPATILQKLAAQVYASGLRSIEGNLIADDSYFVTQPFGSGWEVDDLLWGYAPPVTALALNDNILNIHVLPGRIAHQPARVRVELLEDYYQVENRVLTGPRTKTLPGGGSVNAERFLGVARRPGSKRVVLWGQVPVRGTGWSRQLSVEDPPEFAGEVFRRELVRRGIKISGDLIVRRSEPFDFEDLTGSARPPEPLSATVLADYLSVPLAESLKVILKTSQNLHAEMLLRTLGRERRNVGSIEAGLEQVYEFLQQMDVRENQMILRGGSGLSRQNLVTPSAMVQLLRKMHQSEHGAAWRDMLPIAGEDGSLAGRLRGASTRGRVWAKTGSLTGVAALAGYVENKDGELLAFAIFVNNSESRNGTITRVIDRIVRLIAGS